MSPIQLPASYSDQFDSVAPKILIVDDDPSVIRMIVEYLLPLKNVQVVRAGSGVQALSVIPEEQPNLIIMDWHMPEMNGIETLIELRKQEGEEEIPVIMTSGVMIAAGDLELALKSGAWDFIRKPIDLLELSARIDSCLRLKHQQEQLNELMKQEVDLKNRKLSTATILLQEKTNLLSSMMEKIDGLLDSHRSWDSEKEKAIFRDLRRVRKGLNSEIKQDDTWAHFKIHFEDVNPDFFEKLTTRCKGLSQYQQRLCAYLKIGMDTKEIAQIMNVTDASVRSAIYRMKKKIDLSEEDSMRTFLFNL